MNDINKAIKRAEESLKPFQRATVAAINERFFKSKQRYMLVADETGLGKTIVARGIIALMLKKHQRSKRKNRSLRITYICSNQAIAGENIEKLNFLPRKNVDLRRGNRIAYMARAMEENVNGDTFLSINSLTPGTSFQTSQTTGVQDERILIYCVMLDGIPEFRRRADNLAAILKGTVTRETWASDLRWYRKYSDRFKIREGISESFVNSLNKTKIKHFLTSDQMENLTAKVVGPTLMDLMTYWVERVQPSKEEKYHWYCLQLIKILRRIMTQVCLEFVNADLYILDEFQRFDRLIRIYEEEEQDIEPEETTIARKVFGAKKAKVLLLSATPFKAYGGHNEQDGADVHYREFATVLRFLLEGREDRIKSFEHHRRLLYRQLTSLESGKLRDVNVEHRNALESILKPIICRTERTRASDDFNSMMDDVWQNKPLRLYPGDVRNFIATDEIVGAIAESRADPSFRTFKPLEYCKSAPGPLSFLSGYKIRQVLGKEEVRNNASVKRALKNNAKAWIDLTKVGNYSWSPRSDENSENINGRLARLVDDTLPGRSVELLWVPPSLPYYRLEGPFDDQLGFSKTLIFSSWVMVPRMISTLLSYEIERMTIADTRTREVDKETNVRKYFVSDEKKRHPIPQLTFATRGEGEDKQLVKMTNFCLLYPSLFLSEITDPAEQALKKESLDSYRRKLKEIIQIELDKLKLNSLCEGRGSSDRWYWVAPLLLDKAHHEEEMNDWLNWTELRKHTGYFRKDETINSGREQHFSLLIKAFQNPNSIGLGKIPKDLSDVLADMAIASPAIVAYRSLENRVFVNSFESRISALNVADSFLALFNKPESIAAVRLTTDSQSKPVRPYWYRVLQYCMFGCLQAVFDEYLHLLEERFSDSWSLVAHLAESININTSSVRVDDLKSFQKRREPKMRTHGAVELGNQRLETDEGEKRVTSLRQNFNSPFRPFIMATTSIGQEGLDFHTYCRRIVHWNLPGNPIDLEQREGRINRYKGLVIRQEIADKYRSKLNETKKPRNIWNELFDLAIDLEPESKKSSGLVPFWALNTNKYRIERIIPLYPYSRDGTKLKRILRTLAIYRLTFGQPRQSELVEYLEKNFTKDEIRIIREKLMVDLSPINNQQE